VAQGLEEDASAPSSVEVTELPPFTRRRARVLAMVGYQLVFGHRPAPRAIYLNMLAALLVLGASVLLVRG